MDPIIKGGNVNGAGSENPLVACDIEQLRHVLADRLDVHPMQEWSAPLLLAVIGLLDAQGLRVALEAREAGKSRLRVVG